MFRSTKSMSYSSLSPLYSSIELNKSLFRFTVCRVLRSSSSNSLHLLMTVLVLLNLFLEADWNETLLTRMAFGSIGLKHGLGDLNLLKVDVSAVRRLLSVFLVKWLWRLSPKGFYRTQWQESYLQACRDWSRTSYLCYFAFCIIPFQSPLIFWLSSTHCPC